MCKSQKQWSNWFSCRNQQKEAKIGGHADRQTHTHRQTDKGFKTPLCDGHSVAQQGDNTMGIYVTILCVKIFWYDSVAA